MLCIMHYRYHVVHKAALRLVETL